jgi:acetyl esterase/lipase
MRPALFACLLFIAAPAFAAEPRVDRDIAYVEPKNERQTLDVYAPTGGHDHPIVFWIHGGGWVQGNKTEVQAKPQAFVDKGFVFVATNYRFVPNVTIKQIAEDVAKAIRWTHDHAKEYGGDPKTIFVMGHSAGAQLAALICTDDRYLKAEGLSLAIIKGCVPVDGDTYDVPLQIATEPAKSAASHAQKFGNAESQKDLSPVTHVASGKGIPPFLILYVAGNPLTGAQAQRLAKALEEVGVSAKLVAGEGKTHGTINSDLGLPNDKPTQELWAFLAGTLK